MTDRSTSSPVTVAQLARQLREGATTSEAATAACLARIDALGSQLNAFITVLSDQALAEARRVDQERRAGIDCGPLHGVPLSVKDLIDVAGTPTTAASNVRRGTVARRDAPIVERLRQAGAIVVGKCNLHEFAYGTTSEDSAYGPVRHPRDPSRSPGGSSGGSAVAVATGMCAGSIGTDTGGSVRIPSALCGLVGLKPGYGELPCTGVVPLSRSLDHVGPIAHTVEDASMLFEVMRGGSPTSPSSLLDPVGVRMGLLRPYFLDVLEDDVRARFEEVVARLGAAGVEIEDAWIPHAADTPPVYVHIQAPEASAYHARTLDRTPAAYTPPVRTRLEAGRYLLAEDYVRAQRGRSVLRREVNAALTTCEVLLTPTVPITAPSIGADTVEVGGRSEPVRSVMLKLTQLFNLTGHPAITIPMGTDATGLPCGLQLVGRLGATGRLLEVARACEQTLALSSQP